MENHDTYQDAIKRLDRAAKIVTMDPEALAKLKHPKSLLQVTIPISDAVVASGTQRYFHER